MSSVYRFIFSCLILLTGLVTLPGHARAFSIDQLRFGTHPDKTRLVFDLSSAADFRAFTLDNPYRMIVDLPAFEWRAGNTRTTPESGIKSLRYGNLQPGISRIVFDLTQPVSIRTAFIIPAANGEPNRLVIDFSSTSGKSFAREKGKVFGSLATDSSSAPQNLALTNRGLSANNSMIAPSPEYDAPPMMPPSSPTPKNSVVRKPLIIIDPGHGGVDPGARGVNDTNEKNITLALAKELKGQLEATGRYRVALTRDRDIFIKLSDRVAIARQQEADLFISIHADSIERSNVSGVSVYTLSEKASDAQTAKLAAQENRADLIAGIDLSTEDKDVADILVDLTMRDTMNQSSFFANMILKSLRNNGVTVLEQQPHRSAGFAVLKAPDIPSVLIESGFMTNKKEVQLLNSSAHRKKMAKALTGAIDAYFTQVRKNQKI